MMFFSPTPFQVLGGSSLRDHGFGCNAKSKANASICRTMGTFKHSLGQLDKSIWLTAQSA
jgi:hypothetical protein